MSKMINYPTERNFKATDTSAAAAQSIAPKAPILRHLVHRELKLKPLSADQVAEILGESILSIRPRLSELKDKNLIEDSGLRTMNKSGKYAIVWRVKCEV